jgi:hypothetical protein
MSEVKPYTGSCHCGRVRYEVTTDLASVVACNCSICSKKGLLLAFAPAASFRLISGEDELGDYQFNRRIIHHRFCRNCGVESFACGTGPDGAAMVAINVRCLDGVDVSALSLTPFDGRSL